MMLPPKTATSYDEKYQQAIALLQASKKSGAKGYPLFAEGGQLLKEILTAEPQHQKSVMKLQTLWRLLSPKRAPWSYPQSNNLINLEFSERQFASLLRMSKTQ